LRRLATNAWLRGPGEHGGSSFPEDLPFPALGLAAISSFGSPAIPIVDQDLWLCAPGLLQVCLCREKIFLASLVSEASEMPDDQRLSWLKRCWNALNFRIFFVIRNMKTPAGSLAHDKTRHFYCLIELAGPVLVPICRVSLISFGGIEGGRKSPAHFCPKAG
jgi:hypothetical protein